MRVTHIAEPLNVVAMDTAVQTLVGEHDFAAFGSPVGASTVRYCYRAACRDERYEGRAVVEVHIAANGFLRHMVRSVVGTLLLVGRGRLATSAMGAILESRDRAAAGPTAPPHGLYLEAVWYAGDEGAAEWSGAKEQV